MNTFVVVSAVGKDRPGLVNKISHEIKINGGNIELQRSARMADEFAIISLVSLESAVEPFINKLTALRDENFFIYAREALTGTGELQAGERKAEIIAEGADQMGIIDNLTLLLVENNINIESMDYDVIHAPMSGAPLFQMQAKVVIPASVDINDFKKQLREKEQDLYIDVLFRYPVE